MASVSFDTLKFVKRLEASGIPPAQAEALAGAFRDAVGEERALAMTSTPAWKQRKTTS